MSGEVVYQCNGYRFTLHGSEHLVSPMRRLFGDLLSKIPGTACMWKVSETDAGIRLDVDGESVLDGIYPPAFTAFATSTLTAIVIDHEPSSLHFHSAAVVSDDATLVLAAPSGSGKSTLTTALVATGAAYRTDELIAVDPQTLEVRTYPKPLSIKKFGMRVVEDLIGRPREPGVGATWELRATDIGLVADQRHYPLRSVVSYRFEPEKAPEVIPLHRATMVRRLLADSQDAERFGSDSVAVAAHLLADVRCAEVSGGNTAAVADALLEWHRGPVEKGTLSSVGETTARGGPARREAVVSVVIDGRAVLHAPNPGRIIELDEPQTVWWQLFDGTPLEQTLQELADAGTTTVAVLAAEAQASLAGFDRLGILSASLG